MVKNRTFMLGVGTGLIAGALLLQLALIGQGESNASRELTRGDGLGLQAGDSTERLMTEEQWRQKALGKGSPSPGKGAAPKSAAVVASPKSPQPPQMGSAGTVTSPAGNKTAQANKQPAAPLIQYDIAPGSNLSDVAAGLEKAGVIKDANAFQRAANEQKVNTKIRSGTYSFRAGETLSSIIAKITAASSPQ